MADCIFCKIANREIKADIVYEDDSCIAFNDIAPQAPVHVVCVPKAHIATLNDITDFSLTAQMTKALVKIARERGLAESGYRIVANCNDNGGQTVFHIHFHLLGGRPMKWPPG